MAWNFKDLALKRKIFLIAVASSTLSLALASCLILLNERLTFPGILEKQLLNLATLVGDNCTAALTFNDEKTAQEVVSTLHNNPHILEAVLYDNRGRVVAWFPQTGTPPAVPARPLREGIWMDRDKAWLYHYVLAGPERLGTLYLVSDMQEMNSRLLNTAMATGVVLVVSLLLSALVADRLQRRVTEPLQQVVEKMKGIAMGEGNLSERLEVDGRDEIGQVAESFNTFVHKLQTVDEMKQNLISVVSHQLKTPVAEINGYIENMLDGLSGELAPRQRRYLEEMREIGLENYRMICDLLSVSKIERGVIAITAKEVPPRRLVELAIRDYETSIRRKGLKLVLEGLDLDVRVLADQDKTVETLRNLMNNSLKFTDQGSITVRVLDQGAEVALEVEDTGLGMSPTTLESLFTKNRVLGAEASRAGAGLGLFIAKRFMKLQGGDVTVTSRLGKGSCFRVTIPKATGQEGMGT
ncbi:MAG TPA: ATP-binding protein [bacterium]|nr:ATP-binding protein [bacterium]